MIFIETCYKTYNQVFLTIIKAFKGLYHCLENYKYKILVFIDYNNLCYFIDIKNLSLHQVW